MQEVMTEEYIKKCEEMSLASYKMKDYESALCYTQRWKQLIAEKYGYESAEMAHCLRRLGEIHHSMNIPEKEFEKKYSNDDSSISLYEYLSKSASPFYWLQQNFQQSLGYFQEGYELLRNAKGPEATETKRYKREYVEFIIEEIIAAHLEQTLWILTALVPLLAIMTPVISGFNWNSLGVALTIIVAVLIWRTISIFFYFFMTKRHYEQAIQ